MKRLSLITGCFGVLIFSGLAEATLWDRGGGLIYDDVLNITWLQDANYAMTSGYSGDGYMVLSDASTWVEGLSYYDSVRGVTWTGWRLPKTLPVNGVEYNYTYSSDGSTDNGFNISAPGSAYPGSTGSELAYMYYNNLGNLGVKDMNGNTQPGGGLQNTSFVDGNGKTVSFQNLQAGDYFSGTVYAPGPTGIWAFNFCCGSQDGDGPYQHYVWAVRDGDVGPPPPVPVTIDIAPGDDSNSINVKRMKDISVAILSDASFSAPSEVDQASLTFGVTGDEVSFKSCARKAKDVNRDGYPDLVCTFSIKVAGFQCGDTEGILKGQTNDGVPIEGRDSVSIAPCP